MFPGVMWKKRPPMARPKKNIRPMEPSSKLPRPQRRCRKCPPPGSSQAATMTPTGIWIFSADSVVAALVPIELLKKLPNVGLLRLMVQYKRKPAGSGELRTLFGLSEAAELLLADAIKGNNFLPRCLAGENPDP